MSSPGLALGGYPDLVDGQVVTNMLSADFFDLPSEEDTDDSEIANESGGSSIGSVIEDDRTK